MFNKIKLWYKKYQEKRKLNTFLFFLEQALIFCNYDDNQQIMVAYILDQFIDNKNLPSDADWQQIFEIKRLTKLQKLVLKSSFEDLYFYKVDK